jgi:mercuric ion transport protein
VVQARVILFGLAAVYLAGVVVQFFLAGLGTFGATTFDAHRAVGLGLGIASLIMLVLAFVGKVPRSLTALTFTLFGLNVVQLVLARIDVEEIAALHVVNALAVVYVAHELVQRSRRFLAAQLGERSKSAA